jgi:hypothetical protein
MANNVKPAGTEKKPGVWKSFAVLMTSVKVPWVWVGLATLVSLFGAQLSLIIPDATAQVAAGDVSMGAILFMVGCMFLSALETSVRQIFGRITSTRWTLDEHLLFQRRLCCDGVALMSNEQRRSRYKPWPPLFCRFISFCLGHPATPQTPVGPVHCHSISVSPGRENGQKFL